MSTTRKMTRTERVQACAEYMSEQIQQRRRLGLGIDIPWKEVAAPAEMRKGGLEIESILSALRRIHGDDLLVHGLSKSGICWFTWWDDWENRWIKKNGVHQKTWDGKPANIYYPRH